MLNKGYLQLEPAGCMAAEKDETVAGGQKGDSSMMLTVVALTAAFAVALLWRLCLLP
jgi:hypothetical protein